MIRLAIPPLVLLAILPSARAQDDLTVETAPPVVVKTVPQAGAKDVDPSVKEIRVSFSKEMTDKSWSWSTAYKDSMSKTSGQPRYEDDKATCILPVTLEPGKTYAIWINSQKFRNFKDADGRSAVPYLLVFKTKG